MPKPKTSKAPKMGGKMPSKTPPMAGPPMAGPPMGGLGGGDQMPGAPGFKKGGMVKKKKKK